ncbi:hypothetical protein E4Z66_13160 [Aliishimia ponticola]|uniref:Uncharacterized protein n=1 Tax=Aliishimia ponticola TaxID=2499833 RepID=A0A4S4N9Y0_9RHOB|nr:hypothetical protein E4Z66_13160 [Aliishimia ponticola]
MTNEWILDVLTDLKNFARANGLPSLAEQLADTADLAAVELASVEMKASTANGDELSAGRNIGEAGEGRRA